MKKKGEPVPAASSPAVLVSFDTGTRCIATVALTGPDAAGNTVSITHDDAVVTVDVYWPDHPAVVRPRLLFRNALARLHDLPTHASDVERTDAEIAVDVALTSYVVAAICGWSVPTDCTPDAVRALLVRADIVRDIVANSLGEHERFLPASLRTFSSASPPPSEAVR